MSSFSVLKLETYLHNFFANFESNLKELYVYWWHNLSLDPRVRRSPYDEPPENEIVLTTFKVFVIRTRRIFFLLSHLLGLAGAYYVFTGQATLWTILWTMFLGSMALIGANAGAHRLWSHRSFKASLPLRLILIVCQTMSIQYDAYNWSRDHRLHHKYSDTVVDPHNANRGFFFSHIGWLMILRHPETNEKIKEIWTKDLEEDKVVMYQHTHYFRMVLLFAYIVPTLVPWYFWGESMWVAFLVASQLRFVLTLNGTFTINSLAHMTGMRPFDKNILPVENNFVNVVSFGDGYHNYHHVFPWDYRNSESWDYKFNLSTLFIDAFAKIGWAYDMKTVPDKMIAARVKRTGDGSHPVWGWDDEIMTKAEKNVAEIRHPENEERTRG